MSEKWTAEQALHQKQVRLRKKIKLLEQFDSKCSICGYNKNIGALEFHHLDPEIKDFNLDSKNMTSKKDWEIEEELKKCILVCSNCHKEIHYPDLNFESIVLDEILSKPDKPIKVCSVCGKEISASSGGMCVECSNLNKRTVEWPSKEVLWELVKVNAFTTVAKMYSVSDKTIAKWCKSYGLPSTKKEINATMREGFSG